MTVKDETVNTLDDNNAKAKEIIKSVVDILTGVENPHADPLILLDAAADYLQKNDNIFNDLL